jgi:general secretion pathway protein G
MHTTSGRRADGFPPSERRSQAAFTLIEIMAVVIIIGMLTGLVGTVIFRQVDKARLQAAGTQIRSLEGTLELFYADNGFFPTTEQGLDALVLEPTSEPLPRSYQQGGYLRGGKVPLDPWGEPYQYLSPGERNPDSFDLWSQGADRSPGGEGVNQDIGNWADEEAAT